MDFNELENQSRNNNTRKNRITLIALFVLFVFPVIIAYVAYFNGWFASATKNHGELIQQEFVLDIEDFEFIRKKGQKITGKEFETRYWWLVVIEPNSCNADCLEMNLYMLNQTYQSLGKETDRINPLIVLPHTQQSEKFKTHEFPIAYSEYSSLGVKNLVKAGKLNKDLPANMIYLVDPLGNIFMRYPLIKNNQEAPAMSKGLRSDLLRLFKYSRLG